MNRPHLLVGDEDGKLIEVPELLAAGMNFVKPRWPHSDEMVPLPEDAKMIRLPGRVAIGYDPDLDKFLQLREINGTTVYPVAIMLPPNHLQLYRCAYSSVLDAPRLAMDSFTASGASDGAYFSASSAINLELFPEGQVLKCHSGQMSSAAAIAAALDHFKKHSNPVLSIALDQSDGGRANSWMLEVLPALRGIGNSGIVHLSAAADSQNDLNRWFDAGLDVLSIRLNSVQKRFYEAHHRLNRRSLETAIQWMDETRQRDKTLVFDYEVFPGLSDHPSEFEALTDLIAEKGVQALTVRNFAGDPEFYIEELNLFKLSRNQIGVPKWLAHIESKSPRVTLPPL